MTNDNKTREALTRAEQARKALEAERDEARAECEEQARLNGMGASREAKLRSELEQARRDATAECQDNARWRNRAMAAETELAKVRGELEAMRKLACLGINDDGSEYYLPSPEDAIASRHRKRELMLAEIERLRAASAGGNGAGRAVVNKLLEMQAEAAGCGFYEDGAVESWIQTHISKVLKQAEQQAPAAPHDAKNDGSCEDWCHRCRRDRGAKPPSGPAPGSGLDEQDYETLRDMLAIIENEERTTKNWFAAIDGAVTLLTRKALAERAGGGA